MSEIEFELVLPCYNEGPNLNSILSRTIECATESGFTPHTFRLVLVENGSVDESAEYLRRWEEDPHWGKWFRPVYLKENSGYGAGLAAGLKETTAPFVAWSHADRQTDPQDAFRALNILKNSKQERVLVKGRRRGRSRKEVFVSRVFEFFAWLELGHRFHEINAQPKVFRRELLGHAPNAPQDFAFDIYMLYQARENGYEIHEIEVDFPPRVHGFSNWANGLRRRMKHIFNMIRYMAKLGRT